MAIRRKSPCTYMGCNTLVLGGRCDKHPKKQWVKKDSNISYMYNNIEWRTSRETFLMVNPLCVQCKTAGRTEGATVVDHITPHRGDTVLFWDIDNWQALCTSCHNSKTAKGL
jgi:5-methylcytosine-specific restriction enzyme A